MSTATFGKITDPAPSSEKRFSLHEFLTALLPESAPAADADADAGVPVDKLETEKRESAARRREFLRIQRSLAGY